MDQDDRIDQFRKMAQANPDDDLAHFALGQALCDADRGAEAIRVLKHVIKLNDTYSRAYVLLGIAQIEEEDTEAAIETFQSGYAAAMSRGDLMPATEIKQRLEELGSSVSADAVLAFAQRDATEADDREPGEDEIRCVRTRRIGQRMTADPFGDPVGAFIMDNVSKESWEEWIEMSIKVINELRLDLGDPLGQKTYDEHMRDFLNIPQSTFDERDA